VGSVLYRTTMRAASVGDAMAEVIKDQAERLAAMGEPVELMPRMSLIGQVAGRGVSRPESARAEVSWPSGWRPRTVPVRTEPTQPGLGL